MKRLILSTTMMVFTLLAWAQNDDLKRSQDSIRQVMEERMKKWETRRELYKRMYAEDPYHTIDSVLQANRVDYQQKGTDRLKKYEANTRIDTLEEIDLSYANLEEIPEFVFAAKNMEVLILDYNYIKKLPKQLNELPKLKRLYWRANDLDKVWWIKIQKIDSLEKLDISNNLLTRLPTGVKHLENLKELVANENFFGEIPIKRLSKAESVKEVSFSKSHLISIQEGDYEKLQSVKVFKVNNSGLKHIHSSLFKMPALEELQLQENQLVTIPMGISKMNHLTKLSFYKNQITSLPDDLFEMNLKVIDLYYNELEVIPETIGNFKDLEVLFLAHNKIYSLPQSIGQLTKLEEFYAHHNRLSVLPESVSNLTRLKIARVNDNYLSEFPTQFLEMEYLSDFDISNNQLTTLHSGLEKLKALELFSYQENPINFESAENKYISPMIVRMLDKGVTCIPRIYKEEVDEEQSGE